MRRKWVDWSFGRYGPGGVLNATCKAIDGLVFYCGSDIGKADATWSRTVNPIFGRMDGLTTFRLPGQLVLACRRQAGTLLVPWLTP